MNKRINIITIVFVCFFIHINTNLLGQSRKNVSIVVDGSYYPIEQIKLENEKRIIKAKWNKYFKRIPEGEWNLIVETKFGNRIESFIKTSEICDTIFIEGDILYDSVGKLALDEPILNKMTAGDTLVVLVRSGWSPQKVVDAIQLILMDTEMKIVYYQNDVRIERTATKIDLEKFSLLEYNIKVGEKYDVSVCSDIHLSYEFLLDKINYKYWIDNCYVMGFDEIKNELITK